MSRVVGVPREIKNLEGRVSLQPDGAFEIVHHGHDAFVKKGAGRNARFPDEEYEAAGARLVDGPHEVFSSADLMVKDRPGRLHRGQPPDHPLRAHVRGGGRRLLPRGEHLGVVARTSTLALTSVITLPYPLQIADRGMERTAREDAALAKGLGTLRVSLVSMPDAEAHGLPYEDHRKILG